MRERLRRLEEPVKELEEQETTRVRLPDLPRCLSTRTAAPGCDKEFKIEMKPGEVNSRVNFLRSPPMAHLLGPIIRTFRCVHQTGGGSALVGRSEGTPSRTASQGYAAPDVRQVREGRGQPLFSPSAGPGHASRAAESSSPDLKSSIRRLSDVLQSASERQSGPLPEGKYRTSLCARDRKHHFI
jgi:hypothetical protein